MDRYHRDPRHALDLRYQSEGARAPFRAERLHELALGGQFGERRRPPHDNRRTLIVVRIVSPTSLDEVFRKREVRKPISTVQLANHNDLTTGALYCRNYSCKGRTGDRKCQPTKVRRISANEPLPRVMSHPICRSPCVTCTCAPASLATPWPPNLGATSISTTPLFRQLPKGTPNPTSQMTSTVSTNGRSPQSSK